MQVRNDKNRIQRGEERPVAVEKDNQINIGVVCLAQNTSPKENFLGGGHERKQSHLKSCMKRRRWQQRNHHPMNSYYTHIL